MTQNKTLNKVAIGAGVGGLVVGLVMGVVLGVFVLSGYSPTQTGANTQVTVHGGAGRLAGTIYFSNAGANASDAVETSAPITEGGFYTVLLIGGRSYDVRITGGNVYTMAFTLYVPSGVTDYTHDF